MSLEPSPDELESYAREENRQREAQLDAYARYLANLTPEQRAQRELEKRKSAREVAFAEWWSALARNVLLAWRRLAIVAAVLGIVYGLTKFVKWAWYN